MRLPQTRREKEIWHACETLWQEHADFKKLTGDAIREQLLALNYKKGSPNEVYRYRRTWQETRGVEEDGIETGTALAAPALPDPINRAVSLVREEIFSEAQQTLDKMALDFSAERQIFEEKTKEKQEQLEKIEASYQQLQGAQKQLEAQHAAQAQLINELQAQNQGLAKDLLQSQHEHALAREKITQREEQLSLLTEAYQNQVEELKQTLQQQQKTLIQHLEEQYQAQIAQQQATQLTLKELMETQRHQWIQQLDAEKTRYKKLLLEKEGLSLQLEKTTTLLACLQESAPQYQDLIETQQQHRQLLSQLSDSMRQLDTLEKRSVALEHRAEGMPHYFSETLATHFHTQTEWLMRLLTTTEEKTSTA